MRKILCVIIGSMLLFFSSNSLAEDPICYSDIIATGIPSNIPCVGLNPTSEWCKCVVEWNLNNLDCVALNDCEGVGDDGECFLEFNECMKTLLPLDRLFCNNGETCAVAICKAFQPVMGTAVYKNLGECIKDGAAAYGPSWPGFWSDEYGGSYYWCDSEEDEFGNIVVPVSWVDACECLKASNCDASNTPTIPEP